MKRIDKYSLKECKEKYIQEQHLQDKSASMFITTFVDYCNEEIKTVPRIATIDNKEKLDKALEECLTERGNSVMTFVELLLEEIEV